MRVKVNIINIEISFIMLLNTGSMKIFGGLFANSIANIIINFFLIFALIYQTSVPSISLFKSGKGDYFVLINLYIIIMIIAEIWYTTMTYGISIGECFLALYKFLYCLYAIPFFSLLESGRLEITKLLKYIIFFTVFSLLIRTGISVTEYFSGRVLFPGLALEGAAVNWKTNNILRLNPPGLILVVIPALFYLFCSAKKKYFAIFYLLGIMGFTWFIHMSRSAMIYQIIILLSMILMYKKSTLMQLVLFVLIALTVVSLEYIGLFDRILSSFSIYGERSMSTISRLYCIGYFQDWWKRSSIFFGIGALSNSTLTNDLLYGHISDIGFIANIYRYGFLGIGLYIILFGKLLITIIFAIFHIKNEMKNLTILAVGIAISIIMFSITMDCFLDSFAFAVPIGLAAVLYCTDENNMIAMWRMIR